jgi:SAM-dependent methyltransferase
MVGIKVYVDHAVRIVRKPLEGAIRDLQGDKKAFSEIYTTHKIWGSPEHSSGLGSIKKYAIPCIEYIQNFINTTKIDSIFDFGCGNWELMQNISIPQTIQYYGVDVVDSVIQENKKEYEKQNIHFICTDSTEDFKKYKGDLLIAKDVLGCWNIEKIQYFFQNILPNFKYAILVDYYSINKGENNIAGITTGADDCIDPESPPFNLKCEESKVYEINFNVNGRKWTKYKKISLWVNPNYTPEQ